MSQEISKISKIAIIGGTHGDELTGIHLVKHWQKQQELINRESFSAQTLIANTNAHRDNKRYLDCDLNRQFLSADLANPELGNYEQSRAKAINVQLGSKSAPCTDLIVDLHNTTSNMGPTLILMATNAFTTQLCAYMQRVMPEVSCLFQDGEPDVELPYLCTLATHGVIIEVGPQPQSVLRQDVLTQMAAMTYHILDFVDLFNQERLPALAPSIDVFRYTRSISLPVENGEIIGLIHHARQDKDFVAMRHGDPLFQLLDGSVVYWQGETTYPHFINEAAYYDNHLAMSLADKITLEVIKN